MVLDRVAAIAAVVSAVASVVLAGVAVWALQASRGTLKAARQANEAARAANKQAKLDSIAQTRPYVYVESLPGLAGVRSWDIRVVNSGRSAAKDLTLDYTDWPDEFDAWAQAIHTFFTTPRTLPPGCQIRAIWRIDADPPSGLDQRATPAPASGSTPPPGGPSCTQATAPTT